MNKNRLETIFKGVVVIMGIGVILLNFLGALTTSAGIALLSIVLATLSGMTIGSILKN
ncbi:MAG: hypothetical protein ABSF99_04205 [Anaerolineales bacterium]